MLESSVPDLRIEWLATALLKPNPRNARTHSDRQIAQIGASIERFGWLVPIIVDSDAMIAAGHGRWLAAKRRRMAKVPVIRAEFLTDADRRAFTLAENRLAQLSDWDAELLGQELTVLFEGGYDLEITGFNIGDVDFALPEEKVSKQRAESVELPDPAASAVSMPGDLWHIGPHRLYCGDARATASYEALLGDERAAMVFADPPYNVPISGHVSGLGKVQHREFVQASGEMSPSEFTAFLRAIFRNLVRFSTDGSIHYQCMDWRHMREITDAADGVYSLKQLIVWNKQSGGMGSFYRSQHELVFAFKAGTAAHTNTFGFGESGRYRTNVWDYRGANTFYKGRKRDLADHPTIKPIAMVYDAILDCSHRGELILDPFCGSGTTLIAAHKARRRGAAIELDPLYVDTALRRLGDATGLTAVLAGDGRSFAEIAAERGAGRGG